MSLEPTSHDPSPRSSRPDGVARVVLASGRPLAYATYGDPEGAPVLAFHGAPAARTMYAIADAEARRLKLCLIAPDRPGYGLSPMDTAPTLQSRTSDFVEFLDKLGRDRVALLGVSGGGPYATALAAALGTRASALMLVSPMGPIADLRAGPRPERPHVSLAHHVFFQRWPLKRRWLLRSGGAVARRLFLDHPDTVARVVAKAFGAADRRVLGQRGVADSLVAMTREAIRPGMDGALADLDIFARPWGVDYAAITAPTVLWQGTADRVVPPAIAFRLAGLIPGCKLERLEGVGHYWVLTRVRDVLARLVTELDESPPPPPRS